MDKGWRDYVNKKHAEYKELGHIECPAFPGEKIYFTWAGFNHLIRKERKYRDKSEQIRRITIFQFAPGILKRSSEFVTYFTDQNKQGKVTQFWSFEGRVNGIRMTVIIRQVAAHPKHFFSIFNTK